MKTHNIARALAVFFGVLSVIFFALALTGCSSIPRPGEEQLKTAFYGEPPSLEIVEPDCRALLSRTLYDPGSLRLEVFRPVRGWYSDEAKGTRYGWLVLADVNARNRFGGYAGSREYVFFWSAGRWVTYFDLREHYAHEWGMAHVGTAPDSALEVFAARG